MKEVPVKTDLETVIGKAFVTIIDTVTARVQKNMAVSGCVFGEKQDKSDLVYTVEEAAEKLKISPDTLRTKIIGVDPSFPYRKIGKKYMIPSKAFEEWINNWN